MRRLLFEIARLTATILIYRELDPSLEAIFSDDVAEIVSQTTSVVASAAITIVFTDVIFGRPELRLVWWVPGSRAELASTEVTVASGPDAFPVEYETYLEFRQKSLAGLLVSEILRRLGATLRLAAQDPAALDITREERRSGSGVTHDGGCINFPIGTKIPRPRLSQSALAAPYQLSWALLSIEARTDPGNVALSLEADVTLLPRTRRVWQWIAKWIRVTSSVEKVRLERRA